MPRLRRRQGRLRKGGGLKSCIDPAGIALEAGFDAAGIVHPGLLSANRSRIMDLQSRRWFSKQALAGMELDWILRAESLADRFSILVCALSCRSREWDDGSSTSDPHALVAPFARRNHYSAAVMMLRKAAEGLSRALDIGPRKIRLFSNSRLPERAFLLSSGLGALGANGLAQVDGLGSGFVIAGAVIPAPSRLPGSGGEPPGDPCGECRLCIDACPVGAIVERGLVDPDVCLQGIASRPGAVDDAVKEKWGFRLYGCEDCQTVCPKNRDLKRESTVRTGEIGPSVSIRKLLSLDPEGVRALFKGTALGMTWIAPEALVRNALISAGNRRARSLLPGISRHADSHVAYIADAARWAMEKCG